MDIQTQCETVLSPLDRCKSGDTSLQLDEIVGHVYELCIDEAGSNFLKKKLTNATDAEKDIVFKEIKNFAFYLATDGFGNRVVQMLFHYGSEVQRSKLIDTLLKDVDRLATHMHGHHVILIAFGVLELDDRVSIARELEPNVVHCACSQSGCILICNIINCVPQELIESFFSALAADIVYLSTHPVAYRVIEKVLEVAASESEERVMMISNILHAMHFLCYDEYGHYIVKQLLDKARPHERTAIIQRMSGNLLQMSKDRFASTVVQMSLCTCHREERRLLVSEIMTIIETDDVLQTMMNHEHAKEVFRRVVMVCSGNQFVRLTSRLRDYHSDTATI